MQMVLTQSVVKGAPLAISIRTSSSCPDRAASSSFLPKSTKDIYSYARELESALPSQRSYSIQNVQVGYHMCMHTTYLCVCNSECVLHYQLL